MCRQRQVDQDQVIRILTLSMVAKAPHSFNQAGSECTVEFDVGAAAKKEIKCDIKSNRLKVAVKGAVLYDDELLGRIDVDESMWMLEDKGAGKKFLVVTLQKLKDAPWA